MELKLLPDYHSGFLIEVIRLAFVEGLFLVLNLNFDLDIHVYGPPPWVQELAMKKVIVSSS